MMNLCLDFWVITLSRVCPALMPNDARDAQALSIDGISGTNNFWVIVILFSLLEDVDVTSLLYVILIIWFNPCLIYGTPVTVS